MNQYLLEFDGISCMGCVRAVERQLTKIEDSHLLEISKTTGNAIMSSKFTENDFQDHVGTFSGCCTSCDVSLKSITSLENKDLSMEMKSKDEYTIIKKQYKQALERIVAKEEVACSEYCVCKTTDVDRFKEFPSAPSFSAIFNLVDVLQSHNYLRPGISVVDFGSGTGHDAFQIAPKIAPGYLTGIDVTPEMVEFAKSTNKKLNIPNLAFHESKTLERVVLPVSQDLIYTNNVFNLLIDKTNFLQQTKQALKSNGHLIIVDEFMVDVLPSSLRTDLSFQCGGIADAQKTDYIINLCQKIGFILQQEEILRTYEISYDNKGYQMKSCLLSFQKSKTS